MVNSQKGSYASIIINSSARFLILGLTFFLLLLTWGEPFGLWNLAINFFNINPMVLLKKLALILFKMVLIIGLGVFVIYLSKSISNKILSVVEDDNVLEINEREARARTLINVSNNIIKIVVIIMVLFSVLSELNVNIAPLLTGAGIVGLAIGFGAQTLVKDFFSGFFILMENQFAVGDVIKTGELAGLVEKITLRTTILRDLAGTVHTIPNGNINTVSNLTHQWSRAVLDINVSYNENIDRVIQVLNSIADEIHAEAEWSNILMEKPQVLGVDKLGESGVVIKVIAQTRPIKQWDVMRELNKRIKNRFDVEGIEIPFPHVKVILHPDQKKDQI